MLRTPFPKPSSTTSPVSFSKKTSCLLPFSSPFSASFSSTTTTTPFLLSQYSLASSSSSLSASVTGVETASVSQLRDIASHFSHLSKLYNARNEDNGKDHFRAAAFDRASERLLLFCSQRQKKAAEVSKTVATTKTSSLATTDSSKNRTSKQQGGGDEEDEFSIMVNDFLNSNKKSNNLSNHNNSNNGSSSSLSNQPKKIQNEISLSEVQRFLDMRSSSSVWKRLKLLIEKENDNKKNQEAGGEKNTGEKKVRTRKYSSSSSSSPSEADALQSDPYIATSLFVSQVLGFGAKSSSQIGQLVAMKKLNKGKPIQDISTLRRCLQVLENDKSILQSLNSASSASAAAENALMTSLMLDDKKKKKNNNNKHKSDNNNTHKGKSKAAVVVVTTSTTDSRALSFPLKRTQILGLEHYEDLRQRIPRSEVAIHERILRKVARELKCEIEICGSYRRGKPTCGDIDCIVWSRSSSSHLLLQRFVDRLRITPGSPFGDNPISCRSTGSIVSKAVSEALQADADRQAEVDTLGFDLEGIDDEGNDLYDVSTPFLVTSSSSSSSSSSGASSYLQSRNYIMASFATGTTKFMGLCRLNDDVDLAADEEENAKSKTTSSSSSSSSSSRGSNEHLVRRIDIRWVPEVLVPTAKLYFTGSATHNVFMRNIAIEKNMILNEYGLFKKIPVSKREMKEIENQQRKQQEYQDKKNEVERKKLDTRRSGGGGGRGKKSEQAEEEEDETTARELLLRKKKRNIDLRSELLRAVGTAADSSETYASIHSSRRAEEVDHKEMIRSSSSTEAIILSRMMKGPELKESGVVCERIPVSSEQDVFEALDMKYVEPKDRE